MRMIDVFSPGCGIWVGSAAEARKKIEFQMIVAVDQSGKDQMASQIQFRPASGWSCQSG